MNHASGFCIPVSALSMHNYGMYIIAIGWLYVTLLVAANEPTVVSGVISFLFYGLLPCSLLLWISGSKVRRQRRAYREAQLARSTQPDQAGHPTGNPITPEGEETLAVRKGAESAAENGSNTSKP